MINLSEEQWNYIKEALDRDKGKIIKDLKRLTNKIYTEKDLDRKKILINSFNSKTYLLKLCSSSILEIISSKYLENKNATTR